MYWTGYVCGLIGNVGWALFDFQYGLGLIEYSVFTEILKKK
jgi:hypothetical protein